MTNASDPRPEIFTPVDAIFEFPADTPESRYLISSGDAKTDLPTLRKRCSLLGTVLTKDTA